MGDSVDVNEQSVSVSNIICKKRRRKKKTDVDNKTHIFRCRDLNPGLSGESRVS